MLSLIRRRLAVIMMLSLGGSLFSAPVLAEEELIFNIFIPRVAPLYKNALEPWAREVEAAANGELKITIPASSLAPPAKQFDIIQDGVADISVAPLAFKRKHLGPDLLAALPLISKTATAHQLPRGKFIKNTRHQQGSGRTLYR